MLFRIGLIGRLTEIKNPQMFIRAIDSLFKKPTDFFIQGLIFGAGELEVELRQMKKDFEYSGSHVIRFMGWHHDVFEVYKEVDIVVCTSDNEGTPVALIEAATFGLPIISTDVGSIKEIFKENKAIIFVNRNDHKGLANAIEYMVENFDLYKKEAKQYREICYNRFRKERLIKDIKELYES